MIDACLLGCVLWCRPLAHLLNQHVSKGFVEDGVNDEVDSRVKHGEHVGYGLKIDQNAARIHMVRPHPTHKVDQPRHMADDQDDDYDYKNERHRIFVLTTLILYLHTTMSTQCYYQANIQQREDAYWQNNVQRRMQGGDGDDSPINKAFRRDNVCACVQKGEQEHDR